MITFFSRVTPWNVFLNIAMSVLAVLLLLHFIGEGLVLMIAVSIILCVIKVVDVVFMLIGLAWNHANTGSVWDNND